MRYALPEPTNRSRITLYFFTQLKVCLHFQVYYNVCAEKRANFAVFPETTPGAKLDLKFVEGRCVEHAQPAAGKPPQFLCKYDGSWDEDMALDQCTCRPGYTAPDGREACVGGC